MIEARRYVVPPPASDRAARWCAAGGHRSIPAVGAIIERDDRGRARYARPACEGCVAAVEAGSRGAAEPAHPIPPTPARRGRPAPQTSGA